MIKAVVFDLNGVFIRSPKLSERFRENFGVAEEVFLPVLKGVMTRVRLPNAGDAFAYWRPYLRGWRIKLSREQFFDFWFRSEKAVPEMIQLAKEIRRKGIKIFILSNNFVERAEYYKNNFSFLAEVFDKVYYSWQTGFVKPNSEAYKNLLKENKLEPEECFYFDDNEENIEAARSLGIRAFPFKGPDAVRKVILGDPQGGQLKENMLI